MTMAEPQAAALREALIDQLAYLVDEIEALKAVEGRIPTAVQEGRPLDGEPSLKELYGLFATLDEEVHLPRLHLMAKGPQPAFEAVDEAALARRRSWNDLALLDILNRVQAARRQTVSFFQSLSADAWARTARIANQQVDVLGVLHQIIQQDTDRLRAIGHRLHESHLTSRSQDLPK